MTIKISQKHFLFNLGDEVKDEITKFNGIIVSRTQWINGCNTYGVQAKELKDNIPIEKQWFDEPQLKLVNRNKFEEINEERPPGGPSKPIPRNMNPK